MRRKKEKRKGEKDDSTLPTAYTTPLPRQPNHHDHLLIPYRPFQNYIPLPYLVILPIY